MKTICLLTLLLASAASPAETPSKQGAELLKTDILGVFAHPDDETGVAATIARYALGERKVVAHAYCTRGEGGGNMVGTQWGAALGVLREAELRDCLATLGVRYCYFLDQLDWAYTESVAATFQQWGKEESLRRLVRHVRALRPDVIVTMNPAPTPGQHGHHQAAGVLATEAFDAAADPRRFPEQIHKEGLTVWQPRKLYYGGSRGESITTISVTNMLATGKTPADIAAEALAHHRSQGFGNFRNSPWLRRPQMFSLVKSLVAPSTENDLLAGLPIEGREVPHPLQSSTPTTPGIALRFVPRPAIANYLQWVTEQRIEHVAAKLAADIPVVMEEANALQLEIHNDSGEIAVGQITFNPPTAWNISPPSIACRVAAKQREIVAVRVTPPPGATNGEVRATLRSGTAAIETVASLHPIPHFTVPRASLPPVLNGRDWSGTARMRITPNHRVQGNVTNEADSSAVFGVVHNGESLFVDIDVKDDRVITNIAPNDVRGHWRSDSIEICLDPAAGAEHTLGCFKVGIFPFDMTGVVRAARDADAQQGPIEETAPGTRVFSVRTPDGYRIQTAIPFREIGIDPAKTRRLGFNVIIYDGDKADAAAGENINESRLAWAPRSGVQGRPEDWGRIHLD